jgi:hypothetical protein
MNKVQIFISEVRELNKILLRSISHNRILQKEVFNILLINLEHSLLLKILTQDLELMLPDQKMKHYPLVELKHPPLITQNSTQ